MKIQLKSNEDLTIVTKGGGNVIVPNNTDTSTDKTLATVDQIGPVGGDKANAASLAAPYESDHSSAYVVGDYVTHEGTLYKCKSDTSSPPGEWDDNNWDAVAVTDEMGGGGGGTPKNVWYGTTSSSAATVKVTTSTGDFVLATGNIVVVKFAYAALSNQSINVDETGAVSIKTWHTNGIPGNLWNTNEAVSFVYDGSNFRVLGKAVAGIANYGVTKLQNTVDNTETVAATPKAVNTRAPLASPAFTGTPTAPTANAGTNTTQIANTEFVQTAIAGKADADSIADDFDPTREYTLFESCTHDGRLYLRTDAPVTGGDGSWIPEKWYEINLIDLLQLMRPSVNYSFNDIEPSSYTVEVEDRCINRIRYSSTPGQNVTISPNLTDDGSVTDFYCRFQIGPSSPPFNISISNGTVSIGSNNMNGVADGDMLHFIELYREGSSTHWMVIKYRGSNGISIPIDSQLDANSTNPVENRAIYAAIGDINSVLDAINGEEI